MSERELTSILTQPTQLTKEIEKLSRATILSDQPTSRDAFGFNALVRTLLDLIRSKGTQTPISIGIDGEWGTGKTSILKMIQEQVEYRELPCIWLDAWNMESPQDLFEAIAGEINRVLGIKRVSIQESPSAFTSSVQARYFLVQRVQDVLQELEGESSRLIVFVDDLDRALPDQIAPILKNLKLVLETPGCVFIQAMDMEIVAHAIKNYYRSQSQNPLQLGFSNVDGVVSPAQTDWGEVIGEEFGHNYLEKLMQIRVQVPGLTREIVNKYIEDMGIAQEVFEIIKWAPDKEVLNPRRLKQYINWLSISLQLIDSVPKLYKVHNVTALRAMAMQRDYPQIYEMLLAHGGARDFGQEQPLDNLVYEVLEKRSDFNKTMANDFRYYLARKLPRSELVEFAKFVRENPMLDVGRRGH